MVLAFSVTIPPGASVERVDRGQCRGVLSYYADRPRKKLNCKLNIFILVFCAFSTSNVAKVMESPPPARSHPVEPFLYYYLLCLLLLFLVGCCVLVCQLVAD